MRELAAIFPPNVKEKARYMTVFTTYLDVSKEGRENVYVLAGFISDTERWDRFSEEWKVVLDSYGLKTFHMTDFEGWDTANNCGFGEFKEWAKGDPRRVPLIRELIEIINRNTIGSVAYGVSQEMFDTYVPDDVKALVEQTPYFFAFLNLMVQTEAMMDSAAQLGTGLPYDWRMIYMLPRGDKGAGTVVNAYMANTPSATQVLKETRTEGVFIARDNSPLPFQAADILAFEGRKQIAQQLGIHDRPSRVSLGALEESKNPRRWTFYEKREQIILNADSIKRGVFGDDGGLLRL
jgi:hypothetical protein